MEAFCGADGFGPFSTAREPDFTSCFEAVVINTIPRGLVILLGFTRLYELWSQPGGAQYPYTPLYVLKMVFAVTIVAVSIANFALFALDGSVVSQARGYTMLDLGLALVANTMAAVLHHVEYIWARKSSSILLIYWLLMSCAMAIQIRTQVLIVGGEPMPTESVLNCTLLGLYALVFALENIPKPSSGYEEIDGVKHDPESDANLFSVITFWWLNPLMVLGRQKTLSMDDLSELSTENEAVHISKLFHSEWEKQKATGNPWLIAALFSSFGGPFFVAAFFKLAQDCFAFVQPQLLEQLIGFIESYATEEPEAYYMGYFLAVGMFVTAVLQTIMLHQYFHRCYSTGMRFRAAIVTAVYRKALVLSNDSRQKFTVGEIVNHMAIDAQRLQDLTSYLHIIWSGPFQIALSLYFLYTTLGPSVFGGLGVMLLMIPINAWTAMRMKSLQKIQMQNKDKRIKLTDEVLSGIKVIKLYAWERSFLQKIFGVRESELATLKIVSYYGAIQTFTWTASPFIVSLVTFMFYVLVQKEILTSEKAFVSLSLFNLLQFPLAMLPQVITSCVEASVAIQRLYNFLLCGELDMSGVAHANADHSKSETTLSSAVSLPMGANDEYMVEIADGSFAWNKTSDAATLRSLNVKMPKGSLVAVVGQVGCGKSSFVSALLGEMEKRRGRVFLKGQVAYVPQQAWIRNATVEDNILFGRPRDENLYKAAISCCALQADVDMLPAGDQTEIGEKGINLSGGQKQRVSLARAFYSQADVYVFDDPLSAVDAHVGRHIFDNLIGPRGVLKKKTRVLVTHSVQFLSQCTNILVLKDGEIVEAGSYDDLFKQGGAFTRLIEEYGSHSKTQAPESPVAASDASKTVAAPTIVDKSINSQVPEKEAAPAKNAKLIETETSEKGDVSSAVYRAYFDAMGITAVLAVLLMFFLGQGASIGSSLWLTYWSDQNSNDQIGLYLGIYALFGILQSVFVVVTSIMCFVVCGIRAARFMHIQLAENILRAPMSFFDTTPLGRIVNRFSKDQYTVDEALPRSFQSYVRQLFNVAGIIIVITYSTPIFLAAIVPLGAFYYYVQRFYLATSRELKRLDSVSRSPIYAHFSETLAGVTTIRAYQLKERFILENETRLDLNQRAYYPSIVSNRWYQCSALFAVISRDTIDPGLVGLSVSYALSVTQSLNWIVRMSTELETNIVSVERIREYMYVPTEAAPKKEDLEPPQHWPEKGVILFNNYSTRYRAGLDLVIKNLTFAIQSREKVGIVGRTGAGKSSLTLALFRIIEAAEGSIVVDNVDIAQMGLHDLRSNLTIIPQDPIIFSGTIRENLDPFETHTDDEIWRALENSSLKPFVSGLDGGLLAKVVPGGENLSVGQRQLLCLARALLRKSSILVLDEATAAVDVETDNVIQRTIRREFKDCTIFTIAHRLNTVMDSDRIMVLSHGELKELDSPSNLLADKSSIFYSMAKEAHLV